MTSRLKMDWACSYNPEAHRGNYGNSVWLSTRNQSSGSGNFFSQTPASTTMLY